MLQPIQGSNDIIEAASGDDIACREAGDCPVHGKPARSHQSVLGCMVDV